MLFLQKINFTMFSAIKVFSLLSFEFAYLATRECSRAKGKSRIILELVARGMPTPGSRALREAKSES
jgi:hypothetical protein